LGHKDALATSAELLNLCEEPVFEAGFTADGALAYADVMLPQREEGKAAWKMIEIKSSTHIKDYHRDDLAIQAHISARSGIRLTAVSLAHIDNTFVYPGNEDYRGLLKENDLTQETLSRLGEVKSWITEAHAVCELPEEPQFPTGRHCSDPFPCGFSAYCNREKVWPAFPLNSLPRFSSSKKDRMASMGIDDLRLVPDEYLSELQLRVKRYTLSNTVFFDAAGAAADLAPYGSPAYFLDFETAQFAIPIWPGTRPYAQIPFQFSLHVVAENSVITDHSFLDLSGNDPTSSFAESLISLCGSEGPIFVYATFEKRILRETAARFPEYAERLLPLSQRIVDLLPITKARYYHPIQQGSWSLKAVLPAAIPELSYGMLDGIQDGGDAANAFLEAIASTTTSVRKATIARELIDYCRLDSFALARLHEFLSGPKGLWQPNIQSDPQPYTT
jgi:hypothetical protein